MSWADQHVFKLKTVGELMTKSPLTVLFKEFASLLCSTVSLLVHLLRSCRTDARLSTVVAMRSPKLLRLCAGNPGVDFWSGAEQYERECEPPGRWSRVRADKRSLFYNSHISFLFVCIHGSQSLLQVEMPRSKNTPIQHSWTQYLT